MHEALEGGLVEKAQRGSRRAFGKLMELYQKPIYNLCYRLTGTKEEAEDLTQETFLRAYERMDTFREGARFLPWVYTIGLNLTRNHLSRRPLHPFGQDREDLERHGNGGPGPQELLLQKEGGERLQEALGELPLEMREAVWLRYGDEMSYDEVSDILFISPAAARMRVHRGLKKLKEIMTTTGD